MRPGRSLRGLMSEGEGVNVPACGSDIREDEPLERGHAFDVPRVALLQDGVDPVAGSQRGGRVVISALLEVHDEWICRGDSATPQGSQCCHEKSDDKRSCYEDGSTSGPLLIRLGPGGSGIRVTSRLLGPGIARSFGRSEYPRVDRSESLIAVSTCGSFAVRGSFGLNTSTPRHPLQVSSPFDRNELGLPHTAERTIPSSDLPLA